MQKTDLEVKVNIKDYISCDIYDDRFDDVTNPNIDIDIKFIMTEAPDGVDVTTEVKKVSWSYTGSGFTEGTDIDTVITGETDDTWKITQSGYDTHVENVIINIDEKTAEIGFVTDF